MIIDRKLFEKLLAKEFFKEKNDFYKKYYEQIAVINRLLEDIDDLTYKNLYPSFKIEVLETIPLRYIKKERLEKILKRANTELNRDYYNYSKNLKLNLYERELMRTNSPYYENRYHLIIVECLKVLYILDARFGEVKLFEKQNRNLIRLSLDFNLELEKTSQLLLNKCFEFLDSIKLLGSKEQIRAYIILIESLMLFESLEKNIKIKKVQKKYRYKDIIFISDYIQELKSFDNKARATVIIKNLLELVFKRIPIEKINIIILKKEVMRGFVDENNLLEYSLANQTWYNRLWNNKLCNSLCYGSEKWLYDIKKTSTSILSLNDKNWSKTLEIKEFYGGNK
ncbi:hypothetical protein [Cetobacterium sp.]|uniref:hypothetical protein n=1 Tax=Cetobacterium sp. TaxID=2071632 RepID=UPI003F391A21